MRRVAVVAIFVLILIGSLIMCRSKLPDTPDAPDARATATRQSWEMAIAAQQIEATAQAMSVSVTPGNHPTQAAYQPTVAIWQQEATATAQALSIYLTQVAYQVATPTCYAQEEESPWQDCGARRGEK